jgi:hypothetical protein
MIGRPLPLLLIAWVAAGVIRVLLGSSTSPVAYVIFAVFWVISLILLVAASRQLFVSERPEQKIESICICVGVLSLLLQGLLGHGSTTPFAALVFLISVIVLLLIYARRLRREHFIPS